MSVPDAVSSLIVATEAEVRSLATASAVVDAYAKDVQSQIEESRQRIAALLSAMPDALESVDTLAAKAAALESVFERVDRLQRHMDVLHHLVVEINISIKAVDAPTDVKERATKLFKSLGFGKSDAASQTWARVPVHWMLGGCTTTDFVAKVERVVRELEGDR